MRMRFITTAGTDSTRQGLTSDPQGFPTTPGPGLWVPLTAGDTLGGSRYLMLLATVSMDDPLMIVGVRLRATLAARFTSDEGEEGAGLQTLAIEQEIFTSPYFQFSDGNMSFHLVVEPNVSSILQRKLTDTTNFCYGQADGPALLYETATYAAGTFDPATGQPLSYETGITAYTPPARHRVWSDVGGLWQMYAMPFPGRAESAALSIPVQRRVGYRVSLYVSVLQTNPSTRFMPSTITSSTMNLPQEWLFVNEFPASHASGVTCSGVQYGRVQGTIVLDADYNGTKDGRADSPQRRGAPVGT